MKLPSALTTWDWRPLARLLVWCALASAAARYYHLPLPDPAAVLRELILDLLLTFGLLTWVQVRLVAGAWWVYMTLDEWTYSLSAWVVQPVAGAAPVVVNFMAALPVQLLLVLGTICLVW